MAWKSPWEDIGNQLKDKFTKKILVQQSWSEKHNFLELLVPPEEDKEKFFGTHILNVFLAQKFYGWVKCAGGSSNQYTFSWPPDGWDDTQTRYLACKDRFASYKTLIWVDTWSAKMMKQINPNTDWPTMMGQTDFKIQEFCSETPGFEYKGKIDSQVESTFFEETIKKFYGDQPYYIEQN